MHVIHSTKEGGKAAIILPKGVLFRESEKSIRKKIIEYGYIDLIINMPANLFYGTQIPACIMFFTKIKNNNKSIKFIDASEFFVKEGDKNKLQESDITRILDYVNNENNIKNFTKKVTFNEIKENDFNLSHSRYIDTNYEAKQYLENHIKGGVCLKKI